MYSQLEYSEFIRNAEKHLDAIQYTGRQVMLRETVFILPTGSLKFHSLQ